MLKEITVFTNGDASLQSTWSNVPYFFTETLMKKGIKVNRINIRTSKVLKTLYRFTIWQILKRTKNHDSYDYYRTRIHYYYVQFLIRNAIKKYSNADAHLFLSFSFTSKPYSSKPCILFGDWTYEHYFNYFKNRKPGCLEQQFVDRENAIIENADLVFVLFPKVAAYMQNRYQNKNINYIGNVINSSLSATKEQIIEQKKNSNSILFIGGSKYKEGAELLIQAFQKLRAQLPDLKLDIIGMQAAEFSELPKGITCYGYLDKGKDSDRNKYYELMQNAKMYINPTPKWSAFSASVEAMYFYNPVLLTPYDEFIETFGNAISFGQYYDGKQDLATAILQIFQHPNYGILCENAHEAVKGFTWNAYIDKFLAITSAHIANHLSNQ